MQDKKIALLGEDWFNGNYVFTEWDGHVGTSKNQFPSFNFAIQQQKSKM